MLKILPGMKMYVKKYVPKQVDLIYVDLNPTKGHEQKEKKASYSIKYPYF